MGAQTFTPVSNGFWCKNLSKIFLGSSQLENCGCLCLLFAGNSSYYTKEISNNTFKGFFRNSKKFFKIFFFGIKKKVKVYNTAQCSCNQSSSKIEGIS